MRVDRNHPRIYSKLMAGSYLGRKRIPVPNFVNLADFLCWETTTRQRGIQIHTLDNDLWVHLGDIAEKLSFVWLAYDQFDKQRKIPRGLDLYGKYYFYNFIIYAKAALDSVSVLLNYHYDLGFSKGDIDLNKAKFVAKLGSLRRFSGFEGKYSAEIARISKLRDIIIHRHAVDLVSKPLRKDWSIVVAVIKVARAFSYLEKGEQIPYEGKVAVSVMRDMRAFLLSLVEEGSTEILKDLRREYPRHEFSRSYYK